MKTKTLITSVALAGALIAGTTAVKANPELELISGTSSTLVIASSPLGVLTYDGPIGQWKINVTSGENDLGGVLDPVIDVSSLDTAKGYRGALSGLTIEYTSGGNTANGSVTGAIGGTTTTSVLDQQYLGYTPFGTTRLLTSIGPLTGGVGGVFSGSATGSTGVTTAPYWLTEVVTISGATRGNQQTSFDANSAVPDGGTTMFMLGSVLAGLSGLRSKPGAKRS